MIRTLRIYSQQISCITYRHINYICCVEHYLPRTYLSYNWKFVPLLRLPRWLSGKESACQCRRPRRRGFDPWVGKIPWRRTWQPTPVFLPGESHGWRNLVGYRLWGCKELDTTKRLSTHTGQDKTFFCTFIQFPLFLPPASGNHKYDLFFCEFVCFWSIIDLWGFPSGSVVKNPPAMQEPQETWVPSLGREDPLEEGMATHSSVLAWRIPWTEETGGLQSIASLRVEHDWNDLAWIIDLQRYVTSWCVNSDSIFSLYTF